MINDKNIQDNPFAKIFYNAFCNDVLFKSIFIGCENSQPLSLPTQKFIAQFNQFLNINNQAKIDLSQYIINEKKVLDFALFLRGYMRDSQEVLKKTTLKQTVDQNLIELFKASSNYIVASNPEKFRESSDYILWKVELKNKLKDAELSKNAKCNPSQKNLFLFMPFRVAPKQEEVKKWICHNMQQSLDNNQIFSNTQIYATHLPPAISRARKVVSTLMTIDNPQNYFEKADLEFVKKNFLPFLGQALVCNEKDEFISGQKISSEQLASNFKNLTIFSYCASTTDAHRCINALEYLGSQLYKKEELNKALENIFVVSYAFLPMQSQSKYSGAHFYSHLENDANQVEPFTCMNNPELYKKTKCQQKNMPAKISTMPDKRNFCIALKMNPEIIAINEQRFEYTKDKENGHNIKNLTQHNLTSVENFGLRQFRTVLQNACQGKRGADVFQSIKENQASNTLVSNYLLRQANTL